METKRRAVYYLAAFIVLIILFVEATNRLPWGSMVVAPASLDGMVTISTSPDQTRTFITYAPYHPSFWRRLFHSTLSGAFVVQHREPTHRIIAHAGSAHIVFQGDLLSVDFANSSRFVFTTRPEGSLHLEQAAVDYSMGIASFRVTRLATHSDFVASHDWTKNSCGFQERSD